MIKYITCATALLSLVDLDSVAAIRGNNESKRQHGLRKLYYSEGHEVTDVQTKCEQVIEGDPKQCIIVCVEMTSIKNGDELVGEYSEVNQRECEAGWEHDGHDGYDVDWEGHTEWPTYSPTQFPTFESADDGHDVDTMLTGDGRDRIIDWTDNGSTSHADEILVAGGSKGSKSDGYSKGSNGGYSKSSKSEGGKGEGQSKSSKVYYFDNGKGGGGSGYSKSSKLSGLGDAVVWGEAKLKPINDESEAVSWSGGASIIDGDKVFSTSKSSKRGSVSWSSGGGVVEEGSGVGSGSSKSSMPTAESASWSGGVGGSSKSSKLQSDSWSSGAGVVKEGSGSGSSSSKSSKPTVESASWSGGVGGSSKSSEPRSGSSKSSKLVADSGEWESAKRSDGGKGSGSSKSSKPAGGSADVIDGKRFISDGESGGWS